MSAHPAKWAAHPAKWTAHPSPGIPRSLRKPALMGAPDDTPITTIDNPPPFNVECESAVGRAVNNLRHGRRIAYDDAQDLMDQGFDLNTIEAGYNRSNE